MRNHLMVVLFRFLQAIQCETKPLRSPSLLLEVDGFVCWCIKPIQNNTALSLPKKQFKGFYLILQFLLLFIALGDQPTQTRFGYDSVRIQERRQHPWLQAWWWFYNVDSPNKFINNVNMQARLYPTTQDICRLQAQDKTSTQQRSCDLYDMPSNCTVYITESQTCHSKHGVTNSKINGWQAETASQTPRKCPSLDLKLGCSNSTGPGFHLNKIRAPSVRYLGAVILSTQVHSGCW